jgi:hypothetical protein
VADAQRWNASPKLLVQADIAENRRVNGLGQCQRAAVLDAVG